MDIPPPVLLCGLRVRVVAPARELGDLPATHDAPLPIECPDELVREVPDDQAVQLVRALARGLLEVMQSRRPLAHLRTLCVGEAVDYAGAWARQRDWSEASVASVRANVVGTAIEGSVRILCRDGRSMALALRAERIAGRWRCTCFGLLASPARQAVRAA